MCSSKLMIKRRAKPCPRAQRGWFRLLPLGGIKLSKLNQQFPWLNQNLPLLENKNYQHSKLRVLEFLHLSTGCIVWCKFYSFHEYGFPKQSNLWRSRQRTPTCCCPESEVKERISWVPKETEKKRARCVLKYETERLFATNYSRAAYSLAGNFYLW